MPATQTALAATAKTKASADKGREPNTLSTEPPHSRQLAQHTRRRPVPETLPCGGEQAHRVAQGFHGVPYPGVAGEQRIADPASATSSSAVKRMRPSRTLGLK